VFVGVKYSTALIFKVILHQASFFGNGICHKMLLNDELPLTIGGGIGQSRLAMLLIGCAHIGEVQSSIWDEQTILACEKAGIPLL